MATPGPDEATPPWGRRLEDELALWGMFAGFALVALDLGRAWHQTYAFYGGFEPVTLDLIGTISNETLWGSGWRLQVVSAALAGVALAAAYRSWSVAWVAATPLAVVAAASRPLTGHALEHGSWFSLPSILQAVHVLGAAVWIGTLLAMVGVGLRRAKALPAVDGARFVARMVAAFSPVALGAATALFIAGCATSFLYLGSPGAVFSTAYGVVLVAKVIGFGAVVAAGYYNWKRVGPRLEAAVGGAGQDPEAQRLLSRAVAAELGAASVVLLLTSILVALPMPAA